MAKKPKIGKTPMLGNKKDGARPSKKHQVSALLPQNKVGGKGMGRTKRIAKMEKSDMSV